MDKDRTDIFLPKEDFEIGLVSTAILFFFAGFDTTSTTLSVVVFGLIHHPEVQEKLRQEIEDVIGDSEEITGDHLKDLKYSENVINEALRRYFNACEFVFLEGTGSKQKKSNFYFYFNTAIQRCCTKDYPIPGSDFIIPKETVLELT